MANSQKYGSTLDTVESGNWNVAKNYSILKIMKHLAEIDTLIEICNFGTSELIDEFVLDEVTRTESRIMAITRLQKKLEMLIRNTAFAVKKNKQEDMRLLKKSVIEVEKLLPHVFEIVSSENQMGYKKSKSIREEVYCKVLNILVDISEDVLTPLNESDLIFTSIEEFDPDRLLEQYKKEFTEEG